MTSPSRRSTLTGTMSNRANKTARPESERQARWVSEHPTVGSSPFPEYPDEAKRRGSSRGALPNGNPWKPESDDERPGPRWTQSDPTTKASEPVEVPLDEVREARSVEAPPEAPTSVARVERGRTNKDAAIAHVVGQRLTDSKILEGYELDIEVVHGRVALIGTLPAEAARLEAAHIASSVRGVTGVDNRIRVERAAATESSGPVRSPSVDGRARPRRS